MFMRGGVQTRTWRIEAHTTGPDGALTRPLGTALAPVLLCAKNDKGMEVAAESRRFPVHDCS